jgi:membrane-bound lytic murein transglycosylase B
MNHAVAAAIGVLLLLLPPAILAPSRGPSDPPPFGTWLAAFVEEAVARGFERRFVEEALAGIQPLSRVIELDRMQARPSPDLEAYLSERVTAELVASGREMMTTHRAVLEAIEHTFGVDRQFLVAIWGAETGYGRYTGDIPVLHALATLAWEPRRAAYFRAELLQALRILRAGHLARDGMTGSWAGAMGQPQFMPSSYVEYAVDFDHDGRRDIWTSAADTFASMANYLRRFGWERGSDWGREVAMTAATRARLIREVPARATGCGAIRGLTERRPLAEWSARGVRTAAGAELPQLDVAASLIILDERAFLVQRNYETILAYNCSHRYALSVSVLADLVR